MNWFIVCRYRKFINEDVTIGAWMLGMDVVHEDNRAICATECGTSSIAVWDLPKCSGIFQYMWNRLSLVLLSII
jgi:hypothetical protein